MTLDRRQFWKEVGIAVGLAVIVVLVMMFGAKADEMENSGRAIVRADAPTIERLSHVRHQKRRARQAQQVDANGNGIGIVRSQKTGATARVSPAHASAFQAYINDLEAAGAIVKFIGGYRKGPCSTASMHPCGKALDVCQTARGRVDPRCHLPGPKESATIAARYGLFEGGLWCHSDYGHVQVGQSAAPCRRHWPRIVEAHP